MRWFVRVLFCSLLAAVMAPLHASAEPRLALVIANGAYAGGLDPLANPVNDGKLIAGTLQKLGFSVTLVTDADQKKMKRAVSDFGEALGAAGPTTSALFYYAGHGLQVDGQNYLVPVNADIRREADVDLEAVSAEAVLKQMEYAAPSTSIVILDACRNNPLSRGFRSATRGLARMDAPNGSYVAYSTAPGQTAADGTGKNSPFAAALVAEITKPGQGIEEAFRNVRVNVSTVTNGEQTPWDSSSLMSSFYFAGEKQVAAVATAPAPAPPPVAAPAAASVEPSAAEMAFWDSVKNSTEPGDYAAYLKKFPDGNFAELADSRQKSLEAKAATRTAAPSTEAALAPAATPAAVSVEPTFESPLPDGTIVLSPKVAQALQAYLAETYPTVDFGSGQVAYFAVSMDGLSFGQTACTMSDGRACSKITGGGPLKAKGRASALSKCQSRAKTECVVLFVGESDKAKYKTLD
jgi:uncharacterized caspase-like protein